ncbi:hypothetical protein, partial [uncultured Methylobacterium sp.]|uniref:hypothetical protein n=1 Tax=uncultured Methylobacterium sp. TaxID=157278 RepID=UPI0035C97E23
MAPAPARGNPAGHGGRAAEPAPERPCGSRASPGLRPLAAEAESLYCGATARISLDPARPAASAAVPVAGSTRFGNTMKLRNIAIIAHV